jgi:hypothetical protein
MNIIKKHEFGIKKKILDRNPSPGSSPWEHGYVHISTFLLCRPYGALMNSYVSFYKDVVTT